MTLVHGVNHVAMLTEDLDRFTDFYAGIFELETVFAEQAPAFRHAILRTGPHSWLHPAEITGNPHGVAVPDMFTRGHLDHLALTAASAEAFRAARNRLVECGASDGKIEDLGAFRSIWFTDPDGMRGELVLITDENLQGIHAPVPLSTG
ncbi:VOC family protein [Frankia sp. AgPm24]|uniref:VOC family protein n=1 Tax=Frankia umida TaxID=573489 RepID=A0ABT0K3C2_9ACTN|nr:MULTISPECIES: VOC family protein [Frankia]MCK9878004.1 VOC family protein [Frankia umida]MCK9920708.1 VOC family protein [Frankia sp. AgPm24]